MHSRHYISNAILWAAAIISSAIVGAPAYFSVVLLPALAVCALTMTWPGSRTGRCQT